MSQTLGTRSPHTPADWWVTADQARHAAQDSLGGAATAPDLLGTLAELDRARRASTAAVGAAVEALLTAGAHWEDIAAAVGLDSADDARRALTAARREAGAAIERRLGHRA
ncbi:hypothetical protein [Streptomyces sp. NBC_00203]|uniref:hypothetical protein n=1 Tax=Streptomyces sp. NBC_00203 TaxID=2975680 RepID=UPI0032466129